MNKNSNKKIIILKNGNCLTEIDLILKQIDDEIVIEIIKSCDLTDEICYNLNCAAIIILGGHQSLTNRSKKDYDYSYLNRLIVYTQTWIENGVHVLGICLGSQIIAAALGYEIKKLNHRQIGYNKNICAISDSDLKYESDFVNLFSADLDNVSTQRVTGSFTSSTKILSNVLCLHDDYIDICKKTNNESNESESKQDTVNKKNELIVLAELSEENSDNSGEILNKTIPYVLKANNAYGLQFHPEITLNVLEKIKDVYQIDDEVLAYAKNNIDSITDTTFEIFDRWLKCVFK